MVLTISLFYMEFLICTVRPIKISNVVIEVGADGRTAMPSLFTLIKTITVLCSQALYEGIKLKL